MTVKYIRDKWFPIQWPRAKKGGMMDKFEITKERVVAAANVCPDAQRVLKELFPEAFKCEKEWVDCTDECGVRLRFGDAGKTDILLYRKLDSLTICYIWANGHFTTPELCDYRIVKDDKGTFFAVQHKEAPDDSP